jgi:hypothetical protein
MSASRGITLCPRCNRAVSTSNARFGRHNAADGTVCRLTDQHTPIVGVTPTDYLRRAHLVADLASQVQDADPSVVWDFLTALPAAEVQRLAVIALAGIRLDQTVPEIFAWVTDLPVARETA